jgi:hypothetical protein
MGTCQSSSTQKRKVERLKSMDLFVLDNSLRETSVCQIRGHSLEDKDAILAALDDTGINDVIVASFCDMKAVDDVWLDGLRKDGKMQSRFYAFSEMWQDVVNGAPLADLPTGLKRFVRFSTSSMPNTNFLITFSSESKSMESQMSSLRLIWHVAEQIGQHLQRK